MEHARSSLVRALGIAGWRLRLLLHLLLHVLLRMLHLLLELQHLLPGHLRLRVRIAQDKADISGDGAQPEDLAAAIEVALGADDVRTIQRIAIADLQREGGIDDDAMVAALQYESI